MRDFELIAADELTHEPDGSRDYNESVYVTGFDRRSPVGGWMRLGNRPNERYAELAVCLYLPDGRIACQFRRPEIADNRALKAGGLDYEVVEPLRAVTLRYDGELMLLDGPDMLRDSKAMFERASRVEASVEWRQTACSPTHGGVPTSDDVETYYGRGFSLAHFNQHMRVAGHVRVGAERWEIDGTGWRDHSWGPRVWQSIFFYRLFMAGFDDGRGLMLLKITGPDRKTRRRGVLLWDGQYEEVLDMDVVTDWSARREPVGARIVCRTARRAACIDARVVNAAPLRNKRVIDGTPIEGRIVEAFTRFEWDGVSGYGMSEYNDRLEAGVPVGVPL